MTEVTLPRHPRHEWTADDFRVASDWYYERSGTAGISPSLAEQYFRDYRKCERIAEDGYQAAREGRSWVSPVPAPIDAPPAPQPPLDASQLSKDPLVAAAKARLLLDAAVQQEIRRLDLKGREMEAAGGQLPPERVAYHEQRRQESEERLARAEDLVARTHAPSED